MSVSYPNTDIMNANEIQIGDILLFDTCWSSDEADATEDFKPCRIATGEDIDLAIHEKTVHGLDVYQPYTLEKFMLEQNGFVERDGAMCLFDDSFELIVKRLSQTWWQATYTDLEEVEDLPPQQVNLTALYELQHFMRHCRIEHEIEIIPNL